MTNIIRLFISSLAIGRGDEVQILEIFSPFVVYCAILFRSLHIAFFSKLQIIEFI